MITEEKIMEQCENDAYRMALKLAEHDYFGYVFYYGSLSANFDKVCDDFYAIEQWDSIVEDAMEKVNIEMGSNLTMEDFDKAFEEYIQKHY